MILVTGGAGYIGSHCAMALLEAGKDIIIFDNLDTGHIETIETLENYGNLIFIKGDLKNAKDICNVFKKYKITVVIHFAAYSQVAESMENPQKYFENNTSGSKKLLDAMIENNCKKIVFSSTAATYGEPKYTPIDENHPQEPINPYGESKLMVEKIMDDYDKAHDLKSVSLRYFNVAGADSKSRIGEWHEPETHLIPNVLKANESKVFEMYGEDYPTKDGTCVRDYINIDDLVNAHILALEYLQNGGKTNFFNIGTGYGNGVKEVFSTCEKVTGRTIPLKIMKKRDGDPAVLIACNKKAKEILNWTPKHSLEYTIISAYNWEQKLSKMLINT